MRQAIKSLISFLQPRLWPSFLHIVAASCFAIAVVKLWGDAPTVALAALVAAVASALIANLDRLEAFTLSAQGMTAKMRATIDEARATVADLQRLAVELGGVLIATIHGQGRWDSDASQHDRDEEEIVAVLKNIGVGDDGIRKARAKAARWKRIDYAYMAYASVINRMPRERRKELSTYWNSESNKPDAFEPDQFARTLGTFAELTSAENELIADLRHFLQTGDHRRPEIWAARNVDAVEGQ